MIHRFLDHIPISRKQFPKNQDMSLLGPGARFFLIMEEPTDYEDDFYKRVSTNKIGVGKALNVVCFDEDGTDYFWNVFIFQIDRKDHLPKKPITIVFEINNSAEINWH